MAPVDFIASFLINSIASSVNFSPLLFTITECTSFLFNASKIALKTVQKEFEGVAKKNNLENEDDVIALIRSERTGK